MKNNKLKLFNYWKNNSILTYHNKYVNHSFKVNKINNVSLKFINSCWIKKWNSLENLSTNMDNSIISMSIGGNFVNYLANSHILKENVDITLLNNIDNVSKYFYFHLYFTLLNLIIYLQNVNTTIVNNT